jgi:hypothetical protein
MEQITFTISGTFSKEATERYADFLGYQEMIPTPEPTPNPLTRLEFVEAHVKGLFTEVLAQMQLNQARLEAEQLAKQYIEQAEQAIKSGVVSQITTEIK